MTTEITRADVERVFGQWLVPPDVRKHASPIHPGTGTGQDVHGGSGVLDESRLREYGEARGAQRRKVEELGQAHGGYDAYTAAREKLENMPIDPVLLPPEKPRALLYDENMSWEEANALRDVYNQKRERWEQAIERAVTLGHLTSEDASELGWNESIGRFGLAPLPDQLWHVTTAADAVLAEGGRLKTREELAIEFDEPGLGGGPGDTVSYTTDQVWADDIQFTMREAIQVARGEMTFKDMWDDAVAGGWSDDLITSFAGNKADQYSIDNPPPWIAALNEGKAAHFDSVGRSVSDAQAKWAGAEPYGDPIPGSDPPAYNTWMVPTSREDRIDQTWGVYRQKYLPFRERNGGPRDPYIAHDNWQGVAEIDPDQVAVIEYRPKPGATGYAVGSLGEWRAFSGVGVEVVDVKKKATTTDASDLLLFGGPPKHLPGDVRKHASPVHPGTGTGQDVHGGGGGGSPLGDLDPNNLTAAEEAKAEYLARTEPLQQRLAEINREWREKGKSRELFREKNRIDREMIEALEERNARLNELDFVPGEPETDLEPDEYRGGHQASALYGAPAHDLSRLVPGDIYSHPEWYFSMQESYNREGANIIQSIAGDPDAEVTIYRAVPGGVDDINPGDWVTQVRSYAELHGDSNLGGHRGEDFEILSRTVTAKELVWPGDSMVEFGWFPNGPLADNPDLTLEEMDQFEKVEKRKTKRTPGFPHGPSIKWPKVYEALRREGMSKEKAARISNAHWNKYRRWGRAGSPGPGSAAEYRETRGRKARRRKGIPLPKSRQKKVTKHAGPIHPGTGTSQDVHGVRTQDLQQYIFGDAVDREQYNESIILHDDEENYGRVDVALWRDEAQVQWIEVPEKYRRRGVGSRLMDIVRERYSKDYEITLSATTDLGTKFFGNIRKHSSPIHPGTGTDQSVHGSGVSGLTYEGEAPDQPKLPGTNILPEGPGQTVNVTGEDIQFGEVLEPEVENPEVLEAWRRYTKLRTLREEYDDMLAEGRVPEEVEMMVPGFHDNDEVYGSLQGLEAEEWFADNLPDALEAVEYEAAYEFWERHAERRVFDRYSVEQIDLAMTNLKSYFVEARPFIRADGAMMSEILTTGAFLNQREIGESNGYFNPTMRDQVESILFGYDDPLQGGGGERYPIYGYFGTDPYEMDHNLDSYGNTIIELKTGVSATYTLGDSLDDTGVSHWGGWDPYDFPPAMDAGTVHAGVGRPEEPTIASLDGHVPRLVRAPVRGGVGEATGRYVEAQYHEPISFDDDVKKITMPSYVVEEWNIDTYGGASPEADRPTPEIIEDMKDTYGLPEHIEVEVFT